MQKNKPNEKNREIGLFLLPKIKRGGDRWLPEYRVSSEMTVSLDGSMKMYYYDGDMFWGHSIEISVEENGTISDVWHSWIKHLIVQ